MRLSGIISLFESVYHTEFDFPFHSIPFNSTCHASANSFSLVHKYRVSSVVSDWTGSNQFEFRFLSVGRWMKQTEITDGKTIVETVLFCLWQNKNSQRLLHFPLLYCYWRSESDKKVDKEAAKPTTKLSMKMRWETFKVFVEKKRIDESVSGVECVCVCDVHEHERTNKWSFLWYSMNSIYCQTHA